VVRKLIVGSIPGNLVRADARDDREVLAGRSRLVHALVVVDRPA
jgi:hypothetical protein